MLRGLKRMDSVQKLQDVAHGDSGVLGTFGTSRRQETAVSSLFITFMLNQHNLLCKREIMLTV